MELNSLYQEVILDHYKHPHHKGINPIHDVKVHHNNPSCGDELDLALSVVNDKVTDLSWDGVGCSISMASASVLSDLIIGKNMQEADLILESFTEMLQSKGKDSGNEELLEDAVAFSGVSKYPARIKCALLSWMAYKDAAIQASQK